MTDEELQVELAKCQARLSANVPLTDWAKGVLLESFRSVAASARREALEEARQVAIQKGIGNGHMETCAWIADRINLLKGSSAPASPTERR